MRRSTDFEPYWELINRIVTESDLILEILDARLVELSRNEELERIVKEVGRPLIFVINKTDLVSKEALKKSVKELKKHGDVVFVSAKQKGVAKILFYNIKKTFGKHGKREVPEKDKYAPKEVYREAKGEIVVGVLGYPNVGKSSIINVLAHKKKTKVSKKAGTTHGVHWIKATEEIKLIDSPGVIPLKKEDELRYALIGSRNPEKIKTPEVITEVLINLFKKNNPHAFERFYGIDIRHISAEDVVDKLAEKKGHLIKGGKLDMDRTLKMIIRDWQQGKLKL